MFCTIILALGNFLNGKSARGGAAGFKLITLTKLIDTKSTDNSQTLLQYTIRLCEEKFPEVLNLSEELTSISGAAKLSFTGIGAEVNGMKAGLQKVELALKEIKEAKGDRFHDVLPSAVEEFAPQVNEIVTEYANIEKKYDTLSVEYGEEQGKTKIEEFLQMLAQFYGQWEQAKAEVMKGREVMKQVKKDPIRSKLILEIQKFDNKKLKKVAEEDKNKVGKGGSSDAGGSILSSIGAIASKIARDRKERQEKKIKERPSRRKPKQSARLDKILTDLKKMDVNELMTSF